MSTPTNLTPERFIEELKNWKVTSGALVKVRMMRKGDIVFFRIQFPNGEVIQTKIPRKRYEEFDWMNLNVIAIPAVWEDETDLIKNLSKKLGESINANTNTITPNSYQNIRY